MYQQGTQYEDSLLCFTACSDCGHYLSIVSDRMVYLSDIVWTCDGIGAGEHIDRGSGGSCTEERKPLAKIAKDTAAGAVLIAAIMAAIIGCVIFVPKVMQFLTGL